MSGTVQAPRVNVATTVQLVVIAPVVYVLPESIPAGHVPPTDVVYPVLGVMVKVLVALAFTVCGVFGGDDAIGTGSAWCNNVGGGADASDERKTGAAGAGRWIGGAIRTTGGYEGGANRMVSSDIRESIGRCGGKRDPVNNKRGYCIPTAWGDSVCLVRTINDNSCACGCDSAV